MLGGYPTQIGAWEKPARFVDKDLVQGYWKVAKATEAVQMW